MAFSFSDYARHIARGNTRAQRLVHGRLWQWRNRPLAPSGAPQMVFAIPLISKERSEDWGRVSANLAATLASLAAQTDGDWQAAICGQDRPDGVVWDNRVRFLRHDGPALFFDKSAKMAQLQADLFERMEARDGYWFPLDADDILHPGLVAHVRGGDNGQGYLIDRGYMLHAETGALASLQPPDARFPRATHFHRSCGSCVAIRFDFRTVEGRSADFREVVAGRGAHRKVARNMGHYGLRMARVPFAAALYVVGHGENMRKRRGKMAGKLKHFDISPVTDPGEVAAIRSAFGLDALGMPGIEKTE